MSFEARIKEESKSTKRITNNDLICKNCIFRLDDSVKLGNTSRCDVYDLKLNVTLNGGDCPDFVAEPEK